MENGDRCILMNGYQKKLLLLSQHYGYQSFLFYYLYFFTWKGKEIHIFLKSHFSVFYVFIRVITCWHNTVLSSYNFSFFYFYETRIGHFHFRWPIQVYFFSFFECLSEVYFKCEFKKKLSTLIVFYFIFFICINQFFVFLSGWAKNLQQILSQRWL